MGQSFNKLFSFMLKKEVLIVMVGLDNAGKTTILYKLKLGKMVTTIPTVGFEIETLEYKNISFHVWDVGACTMVETLGGDQLQTISSQLSGYHQKVGQSFTKLYSLLFKKEARIVMVGLGAAGKTTILYKLKLGKIITTIPTIGFNIDTLEYKNISFNVWDIGAYDMIHLQMRRHYTQNAQGLIFVVDSVDRDRMNEARNELHLLLKEDELRDAFLLVYANKQDLLGAMNVAEVTEKLDLHSLGLYHWYIQSASATTGEGLYEGLNWLANNIANKA